MVSIVSLILVAFLFSPQSEWRREFHPNGQRLAVYQVLRTDSGEEVRHGQWRSWHENGKPFEIGAFEHGLKSGLWTTFDQEGGFQTSRGEYLDGRRQGEWTFWKAKDKEDRRKSGRYAFGKVELPDGYWMEGHWCDGRAKGLWQVRRPGGSVCFELECDSGNSYKLSCFDLEGLPILENPSKEYDGGLREWVPLSEDSVGKQAPGLDFFLHYPLPELEEGLLTRFRQGRISLEDLLEGDRRWIFAGTLREILRQLKKAEPDYQEIQFLYEEVLGGMAGAVRQLPGEAGSESAGLWQQEIRRWVLTYELSLLDPRWWEELLNPEYHWLPLQYEDTLIANLSRPAWVADVPTESDSGPLMPRYGVRHTYNSRRRQSLRSDSARWLVGVVLENPVRSEYQEWTVAKDPEAFSLILLSLMVNHASDKESIFKSSSAAFLSAIYEKEKLWKSTQFDDVHLRALTLFCLSFICREWDLPAFRAARREAVAMLCSGQLDEGAFPRQVQGKTGDPGTTALAFFALLTVRPKEVVSGDVLKKLDHWTKLWLREEPSQASPIFPWESIGLRSLALLARGRYRDRIKESRGEELDRQIEGMPEDLNPQPSPGFQILWNRWWFSEFMKYRGGNPNRNWWVQNLGYFDWLKARSLQGVYWPGEEGPNSDRSRAIHTALALLSLSTAYAHK
ncbi:MAG: hypothetical protein DWQ01_05375 [Planctomycetota bacterium]|nr:MAG: hypothetical protein DWQ01_05375 [Planctomycetota bacterium]